MWTQFRWHLQNGMHGNVVHLHLIHICDEQAQVAVRESASIATSLECHKVINSSLLYLRPQSKEEGRQTFSTRLIRSFNPYLDGGIKGRSLCNEYSKSRIPYESIEFIHRPKYTKPMNRSITEICSSVTALGFSLSSMKTVSEPLLPVILSTDPKICTYPD